MPFVKIHNVGALGIIRDVPPHELPPEAWTDGQNVRMLDNKVVKSKGHASAIGTPIVAPYWLLPVPELVEYFWVYGGLLKVYVSDGSVHTDLTRASGGDYGTTADDTWTGGVLGGIPILNNGIDDPQMWTPVQVSQKLQLLSNWPASTKVKIMRVFKQYLVGLWVTKSGTQYPHRIKWSHPADPGTVPSSWDDTDATKDAGEVELAETGDLLVDCLPLRDTNIVYKEGTTWGMQFIGGTFPFRFFKIFGELGMLTQHCAQEFFGKHLVVTQGDIVVHNGQEATSIIDNKLRRFLFSSIDADNYQRSFTVRHQQRTEMWFCFPEADQTAATMALVWNWKDNTFSFRDLPGVAHIADGIVNPTSNSAWDSDSEAWDLDSSIWNARQYSATERNLLIADSVNTKLFRADDTNQFDGTNFASRIERTGLAIAGNDRQGNPKVDLEGIKFMKEVWPRMRATQGKTVDIYVGSQMEVNDPVTWNGPFVFDPNVDKKIDCAVSARLHGIKYESFDNMEWELDGYDVNVDLAARF